MMLEAVGQNITFGILVGALYGLAAVGLSLAFGVLKILNVAHGELLMIGGYASFWLFNLYNVDPFVSLLLVVPLLLVIGGGLHLGLFARVIHFREEIRIKNSLLIGFGLTLILQTIAIRLWTADERTITVDYARAALEFAGVRFPIIRLAGLGIAFLGVFGLRWFLNRTYWGKAIRATAEDWETASLTGINVRTTYFIAFALSAALAGIAGTLVTVGYSVNPAIGLTWTLKSLIVVILAGLGSITGTFFSGLVLGVAESLSAFFFGGAYRELIGLVLFLLVLSLKPQGLFGGRPSD
jgi:branched-chain amino acid transport system permease protein